MLPCAYLRIFRPLDTFDDVERARWERYIVAGGPPLPARPVYRNESRPHEAPVGLLATADGEYADVRFVDGRHYVCPWRTRLRILTSLVSLHDSSAAEVAQAFIPESEARRAARELARMKRRDPAAVPSMLQSAWHVPVRWFVLVDEPERRLVQSASGYRLFYWTPIPLAKRRAERALQALRRTELAPLAHVIRDLAQWLSAFDPASVVELDYASVSSLFSWDELDDDRSGREIQESIEALASPAAGGMARAAERYQAVASRWADAMSRESLN